VLLMWRPPSRWEGQRPSPLIGASAAISVCSPPISFYFQGINRRPPLLFHTHRPLAWLVIGLWFIIQVMGGFQGSRRRNGIHRPYWRIRLGLALGAPLQEARAERIEREKTRKLQRGESGGVRWWIVDDKD